MIHSNVLHVFVLLLLIPSGMPRDASTRTTRTPAFWGYPPPPHVTKFCVMWEGLINLLSSICNKDSSLDVLSVYITRTKMTTPQILACTPQSNFFSDVAPVTHTIESYWIPRQKNNWSKTENVTERTRFSKSRSNYLEDIGQGQRSSHATDLLMLVIICTKYGKNPSRTVDVTERTRFSRSSPNDLENIGQDQRSLHVTHPLMLKFCNLL